MSFCPSLLGSSYSSTYPTIVIVHALNPFGMHFKRRVNEDNVDLNRNFLTPEEFRQVISRDPNFAGYQTVDFIFNPVRSMGSITLINDIYSALKAAYAALVYGVPHLKRALVSGNYFKKKGLGYGGHQLTKSAFSLTQFLSTNGAFKTAKELILLDIHTGLGPSGVDTLCVHGDEADWTKAKKVFTTEYKSGSSGNPKDEKSVKGGILASLDGYDLTVGLTAGNFCKNPESFAPQMPSFNRLCITQEFGTVPTIQVGKAQVDENFAYHYGTAQQKELYSDRLKDVFYVRTREWKRAVVRRGVAAAIEAIDYLRQSSNSSSILY